MIRMSLLSALVCAALGLAAPSAHAGITLDASTSFDAGTGRTTYTYVLTNPITNADDGDPDLVFDFLIELPATAALLDVSSPLGWDPTYAAGSTQIEWTILDLADAIAPGAAGAFSFTSPLKAGTNGFGVALLNQIADGGNVDFVLGTTVAPAASLAPPSVPEPTSLATASLALAATVLATRRRVRVC